eukprot:9802747-Alexandrium_andersonii.AAC.1
MASSRRSRASSACSLVGTKAMIFGARGGAKDRASRGGRKGPGGLSSEARHGEQPRNRLAY